MGWHVWLGMIYNSKILHTRKAHCSSKAGHSKAPVLLVSCTSKVEIVFYLPSMAGMHQRIQIETFCPLCSRGDICTWQIAAAEKFCLPFLKGYRKATGGLIRSLKKFCFKHIFLILYLSSWSIYCHGICERSAIEENLGSSRALVDTYGFRLARQISFCSVNTETTAVVKAHLHSDLYTFWGNGSASQHLSGCRYGLQQTQLMLLFGGTMCGKPLNVFKFQFLSHQKGTRMGYEQA